MPKDSLVVSSAEQIRLCAHTTFRVGGPARDFIVATDENFLVNAVMTAERSGSPVLILSGGSNLLVADEGFDGTVVKVASRGIRVIEDTCNRVLVQVAAGENWDDLVATSILRGWSGLEALSGIPGLVGASPVQNVGAYGREVAQAISAVRALDRNTGKLVILRSEECGFSYRMSRFKAEPDRYVIVEVTFELSRSPESAPIGYSELANRLGIELGQSAPAAQVRQRVLELRRSKGMVLDPDDHDTWSAGSFFTNPILASRDEVPLGAPAFDLEDGSVKTSAAWLIENAGFGRGFGEGAAGLSTRHVLALTNRGGASAEELIGLARQVRDGVASRFGIRLDPEPVLVGISL